MALTGELSDLSLAELIEFFCNQRKTGCLKVIYPGGAGYFYLKSGAVNHARFGDLRGIDAVYYALTQANASFTFTPGIEAPEQSINQPWTSVVLEGLRRMDEGIASPAPSASSLAGATESISETPGDSVPVVASVALPKKNSRDGLTESSEDVKAFGVLLSASDNSFARRRWHPAVVAAAVVLLVAVVGVPWALYTRNKASSVAGQANPPTVTTPTPAEVASAEATQPEVAAPDTQTSAATDAAEVERRQREARTRERLRLDQAAANAPNNSDGLSKPAANPGASAPSSPATSNKRATVTVTYDENGRVTAASGGDSTALRIARQKRFPPGKPGSATVTIPIN